MLGATNLGALIITLISPSIVLKFTARNTIKFFTFGITVFIAFYYLPAYCATNERMDLAVCNRTFIIVLMILLSLIYGVCYNIYYLSLLIYITDCANGKRIPSF